MNMISEKELIHNIRLIMNYEIFRPYFWDEQGNRSYPILYIEESEYINAFARKRSGRFEIGITTGLLEEIMFKAKEKNKNPTEIIKAVFGHELSHCAKEDWKKLYKGISYTFTFVVPPSIFSFNYHPIISALIIFSGSWVIKSKYYSRYQENEFRCDRWGAGVSSAEAMLDLLEIIQHGKIKWWQRILMKFQYHPSTEARMENIRRIAYGSNSTN